jgi:diguanylate cyclase (GGDEF)-like protein/PAS domain S-box-containing protein
LSAGLASALCALIAGTALFARQISRSADLVERQIELNEAEPVLNGTYETLVDAETGQRGYLLTGKERYLAVYHFAASQLPNFLRAMDSLGHREPGMLSSTQRVHELADRKMSELSQTVDLYRSGAIAQALTLVKTDEGQSYMEVLRQTLSDAVAATRLERAALGRRIVEDGRRSERFAIAAVSALVLTAVLAALQIRQLSRSRARHARELQRSEEQHRAVLEGQREMVALSQADGTLIYVNPAYAAHFGRTPQELVGSNLFDLVEPADQDAVRGRLQGVIESGAPATGENRMRSLEGSPRWVSWTNQRQLDVEGNVRLHSVGRDTTTEKALTRRLSERERFLRQITDAVPARIAYIDSDCRVQFANNATLERYRLPRDQVIGRRRSELIADVARDFVTPFVNAALRGEYQHIETPEGHGKDFRVLDVELIPDVGDDGRVQGIYVLGVDITRRKADEQALHGLAEIFRASPDAIVQTDAAGSITFLNPTARRALGIAPGHSVEGLSHLNFHTPETNDLFAATALPIAHDQGYWVGESSMVVGGGVMPVNHLLIAHRDSEGKVSGYSAVLRDISSEVAQRRELKLQTATLSAVVESMPTMVAVYDAQCRYRLVNRSFEEWTGVSRARCIGHGIGEVFGADEQERSRPWADRALQGETVSFEKEVPSIRRGRQVNLSYLPLRLEDGSIDGFIGVGQDITEQREEARRLVDLSERDPLTGLNNRAGVEMHLQRCVDDLKHDEVAAVFVDLDRFKPVNDEFGHAVGDEVLRQFSARLKGVVRPSDVVGRLGGDEFAVILSGVRDRQGAELVAEKILGVVRRPFDVEGQFISIGASVGVAHGIGAQDGWEGLLDRADKLMYAAKRKSRPAS